jgi:excisionase family DNA binding protein
MSWAVSTYMSAIEELRQVGGYIGVRDAAKLLGVSRYTMYEWVKKSMISAYRIGNATKLDRRELAAWIEDRKIS